MPNAAKEPAAVTSFRAQLEDTTTAAVEQVDGDPRALEAIQQALRTMADEVGQHHQHAAQPSPALADVEIHAPAARPSTDIPAVVRYREGYEALKTARDAEVFESNDALRQDWRQLEERPARERVPRQSNYSVFTWGDAITNVMNADRRMPEQVKHAAGQLGIIGVFGRSLSAEDLLALDKALMAEPERFALLNQKTAASKELSLEAKVLQAITLTKQLNSTAGQPINVYFSHEGIVMHTDGREVRSNLSDDPGNEKRARMQKKLEGEVQRAIDVRQERQGHHNESAARELGQRISAHVEALGDITPGDTDAAVKWMYDMIDLQSQRPGDVLAGLTDYQRREICQIFKDNFGLHPFSDYWATQPSGAKGAQRWIGAVVGQVAGRWPADDVDSQWLALRLEEMRPEANRDFGIELPENSPLLGYGAGLPTAKVKQDAA